MKIFNEYFIKGFTIVELLVTIAIATSLMSVVLYDYSSFSDKLALSSSAQELVIDIRRTQAYGINVRETAIGANDFNKSYGIYFNPTLSPDSYYIFVDKDGDKKYSDAVGSCGGAECIEKVTFRNNVKISTISRLSPACSGATSLSVTFHRPNPDAIINFVDAGGNFVCTLSNPDTTSSLITLISKNGLTKDVGVDTTGHIYIQ